MVKIFISHASQDKEFVRQLGRDLAELGHYPWLDEWEIKVGECIPTKIQQGLADADYVVLVLSQHAVDQPRELVGRGRDGFRRPQSSLHPSEKGA